LSRAMRTPARPVLASAFRSARAWRGSGRACARSGSGTAAALLLHSASSVPPPSRSPAAGLPRRTLPADRQAPRQAQGPGRRLPLHPGDHLEPARQPRRPLPGPRRRPPHQPHRPEVRAGRRRCPRPALRTCSVNGASPFRDAFTLFLLRSISYSVPPIANRTVSSAGPPSRSSSSATAIFVAIPGLPDCGGLPAPYRSGVVPRQLHHQRCYAAAPARRRRRRPCRHAQGPAGVVQAAGSAGVSHGSSRKWRRLEHAGLMRDRKLRGPPARYLAPAELAAG
jgi:hypothetical protein